MWYPGQVFFPDLCRLSYFPTLHLQQGTISCDLSFLVLPFLGLTLLELQSRKMTILKQKNRYQGSIELFVLSAV